MAVDMCDEWHHQDEDCEINPQNEFFMEMTKIAYSGLEWTEKDLLDYKKIFEGL